MRSPAPSGRRLLEDHQVDRPEVYAQQCVQPTGTNSQTLDRIDLLPRPLTRAPGSRERATLTATPDTTAGPDAPTPKGAGRPPACDFPVTRPGWPHPFPFRTRPLSIQGRW